MRLALLVLACTAVVGAEERIDSEANQKFRTLEKEQSQVMQTLHILTDRYGPRLTGSPNHEAAARWAMQQMTDWGLKNAHLEPWDFGHPGWLNERAAGHIVSPVKDNLVLEVLAWTPSTKGVQQAPVVLITPPATPTKEELAAFLDANKAAVKGKIVMVGKPTTLSVVFTPPAKRMDDEALKRRLSGAAGGPPNRQPVTPTPGKMTANEVTAAVDQWLVDNGAVARMNDAAMQHGMIRAFHNRTYDVTKAVPTVILRNEDYGRIARLLADKEKVEIELNIVNLTFPKGKTTYNVVAEIPGTEKPNEVVIIGGHLDSWHAATGATDNATGSAVMMEAARLILAAGLKPKRTIRVALWSAEEQGLLGSQAYVKEHYGTFENQKPEYKDFIAYFNVDSGTGRLRMANIFGPQEAADVLKSALDPFADLGLAGASISKSRRLGGTDSTSFNAAGLAGVGLGQDPIEYMTHTWHTNLDTYERAIPEDLQSAAIAVAGTAWHVANRAERLPVFTKETMPEAPKPEGN